MLTKNTDNISDWDSEEIEPVMEGEGNETFLSAGEAHYILQILSLFIVIAVLCILLFLMFSVAFSASTYFYVYVF